MEFDVDIVLLSADWSQKTEFNKICRNYNNGSSHKWTKVVYEKHGNFSNGIFFASGNVAVHVYDLAFCYRQKARKSAAEYVWRKIRHASISMWWRWGQRNRRARARPSGVDKKVEVVPCKKRIYRCSDQSKIKWWGTCFPLRERETHGTQEKWKDQVFRKHLDKVENGEIISICRKSRGG